MKLPRSKPEYWGPKLERNRQRDVTNVARLRESGWKVLVVWECEVRGQTVAQKIVAEFLAS
jgi:DNA mismatch endonuclease (patch repair protein)